MTLAEAKARLERMTAATEDPVLNSADLDELVLIARRSDSAGLLPGATGWVPTFDLNAGAAEGWRWKAGKVATSYSSTSLAGEQGPDSFKYLNCIRQAEDYAARSYFPSDVIG